MTASCVLDQLRSFPKGTAAGPSGLRAQHFLDALVPGEEDALAERLARLVEWFAAGAAPQEAAPDLAGTRLIALLKPDGRLRPIAIGKILRRLTSKCLCAAVRTDTRRLLINAARWSAGLGATAAVVATSASPRSPTQAC